MLKKIMITMIMILCIVSLIGCSSQKKDPDDHGEEPDNGKKPAQPINPIRPDSNAKVEGTIHQINVTQSPFDFIKNGQTSYVIVIPSNPLTYEELAATELQLFIEMATGILLE